jgi:tRNA_anti-like
MENKTEGKLKITLGLIISYIFSVLALIVGLGALSDGAYMQAVTALAAATISFAPFRAKLAADYNFTLSSSLVFVLAFGLFAYSTTFMSKKDHDAQSTTSTAVTQEDPVVPVPKVTALGISNEYKQNEVAADAKYKGQIIEVTGTVETIGKDVLDTPYIALATQQYAIIDKVQCMFSKSDEAELATVKKGSKITLRGEVSGKLGNILVRDCAIVK